MSETVEWNGLTLYAPVIACTPVEPNDYGPERLRMWNKIVADVGVKLAIYPGSTFQPCEDCQIQITVGPRQQETVELAHGTGLLAHVVCMICGAARAAESDTEAVVGNLGNPFKKAQR